MTIKPEVLAILSAWEILAIDHEPQGWPNVRMRELTAVRAEILAMDAKIARHVKMLADCFRMAGADPDGNEDWRIAPDALRAVTELRRDYDEACDAMHNSAREGGE